ncbi:thiamine pyrophosphate-binding protein [Tsukamurella pseudospumae]|uniref:acetolactate synthase n=1 Tax=Tsukamurella pseudospumae TaxID=239498 RepID=A0A138AU83_9ACTN|nr:thiamine pyrophosphate-binding protein [Tsukamurella pseudospumae]KXO98970.1 acetolactate synthase [Tsukamurella pseudospumae]KXP14011.1 acetolactate synthase [Tsukamurella pseudospumae]
MKSNGGDLLVQVLREAGVDTVFGVVSVHNQPLVQAVSRDLRFVPVRHEASAVNAADGYARATGGLGCALTSTGTGAGNAAGALIESLSSGTSVLHVTGNIESRYLGSGRGFIHETKDQLGMLTAVSHHAETIVDADGAGKVLRAGVARALERPGGPVSIEWPIDLQYSAQVVEPAAAPEPEAGTAPSDAAIAGAVEALRGARRPVIWAGGGVARAGAELAGLVESWGAALLTSNSGRGAVPEDHELCIGNYGNSPLGRELLADADVLLSIGTHFRSNETGDYAMPVPTVHVQVDLDEAAIGRVYPATGVVGDAAAVLTALTAAGLGAADPAWTERARSTRDEVRARQRAGLGPHALLADAIRASVPRDAVVARDVTIASSSWGNRLLPMYDPRSNIFPRGGGIGQGLGMAIGAALADETRPTVGMVGDGGLAVHFGELMTMAQEQPWLVLVVFNDRGYGVLRNMQQGLGQSTYAVDLATPSFEMLSAALGLEYRCIATSEQAGPILREAVDLRRPVIVEVDLASYGEMPAPFTPPVSVPDAEEA